MRNYLTSHFHYLTNPYKWGGVDLLRTIAILLVFIYHLYHPDKNDFLYPFVRLSWVGVDLFFVLSGFLIGGMIYKKLHNGTFSLKTFYIDRVYRIMPIYVVIVIATLGLKEWSEISYTEIIQYFLNDTLFIFPYSDYFFPSLFSKTQTYRVIGAWSLATEQYFYFLMPLVLLILYEKTSYNTTIKILIYLLVFAFFFRLYFAKDFIARNDFNWMFFHFMRPHFRLDELLYGVLLAVLIFNSNIKYFIHKNKFFLLSIFIASFTAFFMYILFYHPKLIVSRQYILVEAIWIPSILGLLFALLLSTLYDIKMNNKFIIFIARLSYSIYLVHILIMYNFSLPLHETLIYTIFISYLVSLLIEYPFLRLYKKV